jgi:DMSO/TMAO reductase YedYZ molybdopterin-dependent catalytic subunit
MAPTKGHDDVPGSPYGRRAFLGILAGGVSALWWAPSAWNAVSAAVRPATALVPEGIRSALPSPSEGWRIYTVASEMPTFDPASWRLRIDGMVGQPREISYEQLRALPRAEQTTDFHCVTGWSVPAVHWAGVRFADLLATAHPLAGAGVVTFVSAERPYTDSLSLAQVMLKDAMLAYEMDGRPLAREHGAPVRVVIPEMYGYKNVKWVERISLTTRPETGYWEQRGYDRDAWVGRSNGYS